MTRIIVRNLPERITKDKLLNLFSEKGTVTDIQLKYTRDGKFRKFAFIGYQKQEQADAALEKFNESYIHTSKIQVEPCRALCDPEKPRAWSKYSQDSSAYKNKRGKNIEESSEKKGEKESENNRIKDPKLKKLLSEYQDDEMFKDFVASELQNEDALEITQSKSTDTQDKEIKLADKSISDLEYFRQKTGQAIDIATGDGKKSEEKKSSKKTKNIKLFSIKITGLPLKLKKSGIKKFLGVKPFTIRRAQGNRKLVFVGFKTEKEMKKALYRNRTFYSGKRIAVRQLLNDGNENDDAVDEKWKQQEESLNKAELVAESGRIFIRNLPYVATEDDIKAMFEKYGPLSEIHIPIDSYSRKPKGFGFVSFVMPEHASQAFTELDGTVFQGRMLHLLPSAESRQKTEEENDSVSNFKKKKMIEDKKSAGCSTNWNTFFINENALAAAMAEAYNTTKENVLEDDNNAAVRLALGETQIVNRIKEFLEENGVCLDSLVDVGTKPKSNTIFLVKNLPHGTKAEEIREKFSKLGELKRVVLPPYGITAVVEYIEPSEAKSAFRKVAYSNFKGLPMMLEWAPENLFSKYSGTSLEERGKNKGDETNLNKSEPKVDNVGKIDFQPDYIPLEDSQLEGTTIFVKNLNFLTSESSLKEHFSPCGKILSATIARKKDPKQGGNNLSLGYGFIQFSSKEESDLALKRLQFSKLDGHTLEIKRSNRTTRSESMNLKRRPSGYGKPSTKILVRNVPFQAKQKEVYDLFKVFGEIKAVRLPKKMVGTGSHRGFCFVEYHTVHDAKRAFNALCSSTHLYGRRLVLEWASADDDDVNVLRSKTAERFVAGMGEKGGIVMNDEEDFD